MRTNGFFSSCLSSYLHELHDEIYELVLMHVLTVVVCYQKTNIITLKHTRKCSQQFSHKQLARRKNIYIDRIDTMWETAIC
jgi:hypothetical protein